MSTTSRFTITRSSKRTPLYRSLATGDIYIKDPDAPTYYTRIHSTMAEPLGRHFSMEETQVEPVYGKLEIEVTP